MKDLELIQKALEKANRSGVFTLEESAVIFNAVQCLEKDYEDKKRKAKELDESRSAQKSLPKSKKK